jgi:hypothetical protein
VGALALWFVAVAIVDIAIVDGVRVFSVAIAAIGRRVEVETAGREGAGDDD